MTKRKDSSRRVGEQRGRGVNLFAEALTVLILNREVKLIRFIEKKKREASCSAKGARHSQAGLLSPPFIHPLLSPLLYSAS